MRWRGFISVFLIFTAGCAAHYSRTWTSPQFQIEAGERQGRISGTWTCPVNSFGDSPFASGTWVSFEFQRSSPDGRFALGRPAGQIPGLEEALKKGGETVEFRIAEPSGDATFAGRRQSAVYEGTMEFRPSAAFAEACRPHLSAAPSPWDLLQFAFSRADLDYIRLIGEGQEPKPRPADIVSLKISGVTPDYVHALRSAGISRTADLIRCRNAGVQPDMVTALWAGGFRFSAEEIVRLRNSGLNADYAIAWKTAGFNLSAEELVRLRNSGVPDDFGRALRGRFSVDEMIRLRNAGVTPDYVASLTQAAPGLTCDDIIRLRNSGVAPDYFKPWFSEGSAVSVSDLIRLRNAGVPSDYVATLRQTTPSLSLDDVILLRNAGVPPGYYKAWLAASYPFSARDVIRLRNSGVPESYAEALRVPDRRPLSVEAIIDLRNRGVSPETIRQLRE